MEKIFERIEMVVRTKQSYTERTKKGVRQGCVLSPFLFNLYMVEIKKRMENREIGGLDIGKMRIWNLTYADDMVLVTNK